MFVAICRGCRGTGPPYVGPTLGLPGVRLGHDEDMTEDMTEDQLQPADTLEDTATDDVLDEGYTTADEAQGADAHGTTARELAEGESLDERLAQEEPEPDPYAPTEQEDAVEVVDVSDVPD